MAGSNVKSYSSNQNSSFFSLEDVDDDEFLGNSRNKNFSAQSNNVIRGVNSFEERKLQLLEQQRKIENESLESTERSLRLLQESEEVGISTADDLQRQREQLERTEKNLDNINSTLRYTQKKIDGFKSVFHGLKNYFTKKGDNPIAGVSKDNKVSSLTDKAPYVNENKESHSYDNHPVRRLRSMDDEPPVSSLTMNDRIEHNLDQISVSVKNIKGLALSLGEEIESQNDLVDRIMDKADKADINLNKQNKEIKKLLKK